jgi:hypothetical protein
MTTLLAATKETTEIETAGTGTVATAATILTAGKR